jgi:hypothetical protein
LVWAHLAALYTPKSAKLGVNAYRASILHIPRR